MGPRLRRDREGREYIDFGDEAGQESENPEFLDDKIEARDRSADWGRNRWRSPFANEARGKISISRCSCLPYSKEQVHSVIKNLKQYPEWWPKTTSLRILNEDDNDTNAIDGLQTEFCVADYCVNATLKDEKDGLSWTFLPPVRGKGEWRIEDPVSF